ERVLVADGFCQPIISHLAGKPRSSVLAASLAGQSLTPPAEILLQHRVFRAQEVSDANDPHLVEVSLGDLAYPANLADIQRSQETLLLSRQHIKNAVRLGLVGANLGHQTGSSDADGAVQAGALLHTQVQLVG